MTTADLQQATYSIGVAARMTGISTHKLRMWERRYALSCSGRSKGGQREYTTTDIDHLRLLKQLTDGGLRIGDIAKLPMKTLSSLQAETFGTPIKVDEPQNFTATVYGKTLGDYFRKHAKRFPRVVFSIEDQSPDDFLNNNQTVETDLIAIQIDTLSPKQALALRQIANPHSHIIVFYHYAPKESKSTLSGRNITLVPNGVTNTEQIGDIVDKALLIQQHVDELQDESHSLYATLPAIKARRFSEDDLISAGKQANKLNCECPAHLSDLVRRLNAFEDYSQNCEVENWQEAAIHACIYSYTNQARHLIEKALQAVLDE